MDKVNTNLGAHSTNVQNFENIGLTLKINPITPVKTHKNNPYRPLKSEVNKRLKSKIPIKKNQFTGYH